MASRAVYIVELEPGCWLAPWTGDPGRTLVEASARKFRSLSGATHALGDARKFRSFLDARVLEVEDGN